MFMQIKKHLIRFTISALAFPLSFTAYGASVSDYDAVPPLLAETTTPLVMLAMSKDHQLYYKAYTDYDDLDGDGFADTTYKNSIDYTGYFDSYKCYVYDSVNGYFTPVSITGDKYCNGVVNNEWSGNFLNWSTMSRIDEVRKVLYGGYRAVDSSSQTILERSYLPNDAHSFAKYYNGSDLGKLTPFGTTITGLSGTEATGITVCNTTRHSGGSVSQSVTEAPLARVVAGNYSLWAANERWQCLYSEEKSASNGNSSAVTGIFAYASNPSTANKAVQANGTVIGDYSVKVEACKSLALIGQEDCKEYPSGNYKPIGILQQFGDDGSVHWGLITGSYKKNISGGVLRKDISDLSDEINTTTDGTFKAAPATGGIINTINKFRIANYNHSDGTYNSTDSCSWGIGSFSNGACTNWGNPFAEILLECYRYFSGDSPSFHADDSTIISGLTSQSSWSNPQTNATACANLNVIAFNASTVSYDGNELSGTSDLNTSKTAQSLTKEVGDGEGITNNYYFVGENGGTGASNTNQLCTAKQVTDLGLVEGSCPSAPRLDGSYKSAGLAYHANTVDLRTDIDDNQTVTTYGVTLSPAVPKVTVEGPGGQTVTILPACRNESVGGNCGLADFKIVSQTESATKSTGQFYVNWEDSEQGGDYDQDMSGLLYYEITSTQLTVTTAVLGESTPYKMGFGFVVSGTSNDGFHAISGINSFGGYGCTSCKISDAPATKVFSLGTSTAGLLEQPLYYAAKWGGFTDSDGDGTPNNVSEWDSKNNMSGALGADGIPDKYFLATRPEQLKTQLTNILINILERTASGTAAAVVTNTGTGVGAIYQALYNSRFNDASGEESVDWVGTLHAIFIDQYGNIREDNASPSGTLTSDDYILEIYYDPIAKKTKAQRYNFATGGARGTTVGTPVDVLDVQPIWSARDELGKVSDYTTQRANYTDLANTGRYILTSIDQDGDGQIGNDPLVNETFGFTSTLFDPAGGTNNFRLLGLDSTSSAEATKIVNYTRGEPVSGYRNRRIDVDGDTHPDAIVLGDIIHSSPVSVGRPSSSFDIVYGDDTYREFRQTYENRRQVVYAGANDGMLHAFNGGFFNATTLSHALKTDAQAEHPLGAELWAYVPYNVLPHLQWLTLSNYPHVYYVDGTVTYYDVNIFTPDATHVNGWGTILVVGMRLGGGDFTLDPDSDDDGNAADDITLRSAYIVLDVTDPEQPPTVLAEITHPDMGYTTAEPTMIKIREADPITGSYATPVKNKWYLVFGSGPAGSNQTAREAALNSAVSDKTAKLFGYDLAAKTLTVVDTGESNAFIGGIRAADWSRDYIDDALYFGTIGGSVNSPTGELKRAIIDTSSSTFAVTVSDVLDVTSQPFAATPLTVRDRLGDFWVYSGTGRYFVVADNFSSAQQGYYAVKEPTSSGVLSGAKVKKNDLIDTTDIRVFSDGTIESKSSPGSGVSIGGSTLTTFTQVYSAVQSADGWYFDFERTRARNFTQAVVSDQSLVFTEYHPSALRCDPEGNGYLNAPHMYAGIPGSFAPLGTNSGVKNADGAEEVLMSQNLGYGTPSKAVIHQRGDGVKSAIVQTSTGELTTTEVSAGTTQGGRQSWRELIIDWE